MDYKGKRRDSARDVDGVPYRWMSHLQRNQQKQFVDNIKACRPVLERLKQMVEEDMNSTLRVERDPKTYKNTDWQFLQAHHNGCLHVYNDILSLLKFV